MSEPKLKPQQEAAAAPAIAALPTPSPEEVLREKLAEAERSAISNKHRAERLEATNVDLKAKVELFEKNALAFALTNFAAGQFIGEAGEALGKLAKTVLDRGSKGSMNVKITVKPLKGAALIFTPTFTVAEPPTEPEQSIFYSKEDGTLTRNDPRQRELGFRDEE